MRKAWILLGLVLVGCSSPYTDPEVAIIPQPRQLEVIPGHFEIEGVYIESSDFCENEGELIEAWFAENLPQVKMNSSLNMVLNRDESLPEEGYYLETSDSGIFLRASTAKGVFYGLQTFIQLFPENDQGTLMPVLPVVQISDHPKFGHRGMLFDCCRHFMEKDFVKRYVDLLAMHKMNVLHWHLTEDQGWRIEIDKYPKLTEVGAWRIEEDGTRYGGFYTKEEIREVVEYAASKHITVIPEIELPGHSSAAIAAYPWLSCTGEQIPVETEWGVFKDIYCAGNDSTLQFLKDVMDEVLELFPSEYIHIGGDEAPKYRWENCPKCQRRIQEERLNDEHELQSWFISQMGDYLESKGRKMIGWDEILEGGLPAGAAVQSWRGIEGGIEAARSGHEVVMSPTSHCYFDYGLDATDLKEVYTFDPIPEELNAGERKVVRGGECNMWTERAPQETIDSKMFPRILGMSEVLWTYPEERDYGEFHGRVQKHLSRLDRLGVEYGFESVPVELTFNRERSAMVIVANPIVDNIKIDVRSIEDEAWLPMEGPSVIKDEGHLEYRVSRGNKVYPSPIHGAAAYHQGLEAQGSIGHEYSHWYTGGGDSALFNGVLGTLNFRDGHWQALQGGNIEVVYDFGETQEINMFDSHFYLYNNAWIFLPTRVEYSISDDGQNWEVVVTSTHDIPLKEKEQLIQGFEAKGNWSAQYVKMEAYNLGVNPDWHDSPGQASWVFCDEFIVR